MSKSRKLQAVVPLTLVALISVFGHARASDSSEKVVIPEYFLRGNPESVCVIRAEIAGNDSSDRKSSLLRLVDASFIATAGWHQDFVLSAIDYIDYSGFYAVLFNNCDHAGPEITRLRNFLRVAEKCSTKCHLTESSLRVVQESGVVTSLKARAPTYTSPISLFLAYRKRADLEKCVVEFKTGLTTTESRKQLYLALQSVRLKYRMSILDVYPSGDDVFILFGRMCGATERLSSLLREFLARDGFKSSDELRQVSLKPDISAYYFAQTGDSWTVPH